LPVNLHPVVQRLEPNNNDVRHKYPVFDRHWDPADLYQTLAREKYSRSVQVWTTSAIVQG
jgi:hypothetical protein